MMETSLNVEGNLTSTPRKQFQVNFLLLDLIVCVDGCDDDLMLVVRHMFREYGGEGGTI